MLKPGLQPNRIVGPPLFAGGVAARARIGQLGIVPAAFVAILLNVLLPKDEA